jgi:pyruvate/2-oxoglutarate dehydrogenase complex dihydrolipoamide dehydrogenase (E3) component
MAEELDVLVIGAGAAGEAAGTLGAELGGRVAVLERDVFGGQCSFWACLPSKTLLDSAHRRALGADYPWERASARRDWMISREGTDYPDDSNHVKRLESAGARLVRGKARIVGPGRVEVRRDGENPMALEAPHLIVAVGSDPVIPRIEGLEEAGYWTSNDGTSFRDLPSSIVVLGGGPVGVELAQVYTRFGVRTCIVQGGERILPRDHPSSSQVLTEQLRLEGVDIRTGVHGVRVRRGGAGRIVELSDGSSVEGAELLVAVGRRPADLRELGTEDAGAELGERGEVDPDPQMRVADGLYVAGDCAGGMQFTHVADYEGRIAVAAALGKSVRADLSAIPRTTFTDPETAGVGSTIDEAWYRGLDAFEETMDFATTSRGFTIEPTVPAGEGFSGSPGHVTVVVDRARGTLAGVFAACPGASELINEAALAIKLGVPVGVLADSIHAYPTAARVLAGVCAAADLKLR